MRPVASALQDQASLENITSNVSSVIMVFCITQNTFRVSFVEPQAKKELHDTVNKLFTFVVGAPSP